MVSIKFTWRSMLETVLILAAVGVLSVECGVDIVGGYDIEALEKFIDLCKEEYLALYEGEESKHIDAMIKRIDEGRKIKVYSCPPQIIRKYSRVSHTLNLADDPKPDPTLDADKQEDLTPYERVIDGYSPADSSSPSGRVKTLLSGNEFDQKIQEFRVWKFRKSCIAEYKLRAIFASLPREAQRSDSALKILDKAGEIALDRVILSTKLNPPVYTCPDEIMSAYKSGTLLELEKEEKIHFWSSSKET